MDSGGSGTTATGTATAVPRGWWTPPADGTRPPHRRSDVVFGVVLIVLWVTWLVLTALSQPRQVTADRFTADLAAGQIVAWQRVEILPSEGPEGWAANLTWQAPDGDPGGASTGRNASAAATSADPVTDDVTVAGTTSGDGVTGTSALRYEVAGHVVPTRFVATGALPQGEQAVVAALRSAGVPAVGEPGAPFATVDDPIGPVGAGAALVLLTLGAIVLGPRPTRGTRWFWFWLLWVTLGLGVLAYAVLEQIRPAAPRAGPRARRPWHGGWGFLLMLVVGPLVAFGITRLADATHWLWFPRPG